MIINTPVFAQKFALLIGVEYPSPYSLDYTGNDAKKFGEVLKLDYGFDIKILSSKEETTRNKILSELEKLNSRNFEQLIIFYSGHGEKSSGSDEVGYFLPSDFIKDRLMTTAIDMAIFQNLSKTINSKQILFVIDACYSGIIGAFTNMDISQSYKPNLRSRQIITAGQSNQKARMSPTKKLSLYTYYLIKGLETNNGSPLVDNDSDGSFQLWELHSYVAKKVSKESNNFQIPKIFNFTEDDGIFQFKTIKNLKSETSPLPQTISGAINKSISENKVIETIDSSLIKKFWDNLPKSFGAFKTRGYYDYDDGISPIDPEGNVKDSDILNFLLKWDIKIIDCSIWGSNYEERKYRINPNGKKFINDVFVSRDSTLSIDRATGLMWYRNDISERNYQSAEDYIGFLNENNYGGYSDWRLPSLEEAITLVYYDIVITDEVRKLFRVECPVSTISTIRSTYESPLFKIHPGGTIPGSPLSRGYSNTTQCHVTTEEIWTCDRYYEKKFFKDVKLRWCVSFQGCIDKMSPESLLRIKPVRSISVTDNLKVFILN